MDRPLMYTKVQFSGSNNVSEGATEDQPVDRGCGYPAVQILGTLGHHSGRL